MRHRDQSHVIIAGLPADVYFAQLQRKQAERQWSNTKEVALGLFAALCFFCAIAVISWWVSL